ncbi:uncharacterized protein LOC119068917 [Bradysia coprophila]|uniref:uncharacterized protein LOC119068917 n=1 Tax=Bradysia coprophila TaxID=38358 RepID=UPI00187D7386|nr:uncharacterized protein LOC119068917 [Bradysia coprophila]
MEHSEQIRDFLPTDEELLHREKILLSLFDKYNTDEGSDPELVEDVNASTVSSENSVSGSSFVETSDCETEDNFDVEEMDKQLQPFIKDRVNGWAEKGINFQLKTVDRGVTVEEWLEANQEFTTTTKKRKTTVINENNKTTTITTMQTKTTTRTRTFNMRRDTAAQIRTIASGELMDGPDIEMATPTEHNYLPNALISSKKFDIPRGRQKQSTPDRLNLKPKAASTKGKRLSPQKVKLRNRNESIPAKSKSISKSKISQSDSGIFSEELSKEVSNEISSDLSDEVFTEVGKDVSNERSNKVFGDSVVGDDHNTSSRRAESDRPQKKETSHSRISKAVPKLRPPEIVVYSPSAGKSFGKRIDDEFMSVTKTDFKKGIDRKYHPYTDFSLIKKCVVPVNQRLMFVPPSDTATKKNSNSDDCETDDDDLMTSYTTTGHFYRMNSK